MADGYYQGMRGKILEDGRQAKCKDFGTYLLIGWSGRDGDNLLY